MFYLLEWCASDTLWGTVSNHYSIFILFIGCYSTFDMASQSIAWDVSWREMQDTACFFLRISLSNERQDETYTHRDWAKFLSQNNNQWQFNPFQPIRSTNETYIYNT